MYLFREDCYVMPISSALRVMIQFKILINPHASRTYEKGRA